MKGYFPQPEEPEQDMSALRWQNKKRSKKHKLSNDIENDKFTGPQKSYISDMKD